MKTTLYLHINNYHISREMGQDSVDRKQKNFPMLSHKVSSGRLMRYKCSSDDESGLWPSKDIRPTTDHENDLTRQIITFSCPRFPVERMLFLFDDEHRRRPRKQLNQIGWRNVTVLEKRTRIIVINSG